MTIDQWLKSTQVLLSESSTTPELDARVLLEHTLLKTSAWLRAHNDEILDEQTLKKLSYSIKKRQRGEPLAYITGVKEFYGRTFYVNKRVLVPRPESESLIDLLKSYAQDNKIKHSRIADIGAGSGCLGITAGLELNTPYVDLYDIDKDTFTVSKKNVRNFLTLRAQYYHTDLLEPNWGPYDYILANLPYVPIDYPINNAARHEPAVALFAGKDGLDAYRKLFGQLAAFHWKPKAIVTESLDFQHEYLDKIATDAGYKLYESSGLGRLYIPV